VQYIHITDISRIALERIGFSAEVPLKAPLTSLLQYRRESLQVFHVQWMPDQLLCYFMLRIGKRLYTSFNSTTSPSAHNSDHDCKYFLFTSISWEIRRTLLSIFFIDIVYRSSIDFVVQDLKPKSAHRIKEVETHSQVLGAMPTRCFCPPESCPDILWALSDNPTISADPDSFRYFLVCLLPDIFMGRETFSLKLL